MAELSTIISVLSIVSIIVGFVVQHFTVISKLREQMYKCNTELSDRIKEVEVKSNLFWKIVETEIPKIIHSPHTPKLDTLLEKIEKTNLEFHEMKELYYLLKEEKATNSMDTGRKLAISLYIAMLEQKFGDRIK